MSDITLGGRTFKVLDFERRTVLQDHYLQRYIRAIGCDRVIPQDNEDNSEYLVRLHTCIIDSGKAPDLIAGYLLPADKTNADFTLESAAETAKFIKQLDTPADREQVIQLALEVAFGFFKQGLEQFARSLAYSIQASAAATAESPEAIDTVH